MSARIPTLRLAVAVVACGGSTTVEPGSGGSSSGGAGATTSAGGAGGQGGDGASGGGTSAAGGASGGTICNPSTVVCDGPIPACPPGQVPAVEAGCWGECVPILTCATEPSCDDCQTGFCAEYQAFTIEYRCVMPTLMCSSLSCPCVAEYFCPAPFDACVATPGPADVACGCPSC
ncbi:MAG: hypothetical protein RIF41_38915 [Polyangiaceae bacterium]